MAKIFITGSADGLGQLAAKQLVAAAHEVVLHARNEKRAEEALRAIPGAALVLTADVSSMKATEQLADAANAWGDFDVVIHNAGVYDVPAHARSIDGVPLLLAVNTLAPYILTCKIHKPRRLIYLSSGMHQQGDASLSGLQKNRLSVTYSDTKLHDLILAKAVARCWQDVSTNAVDPGWVPTKMGGAGAPGNLQQGYETQVWLATSNDPAALVSGRYLYHQQEHRYRREADEVAVQHALLEACQQISGMAFPAA